MEIKDSTVLIAAGIIFLGILLSGLFTQPDPCCEDPTRITGDTVESLNVTGRLTVSTVFTGDSEGYTGVCTSGVTIENGIVVGCS